jgi:hypothetical protein
MARGWINTQLFALRQAPPPAVDVAGRRYELVKVFKHDFYAATAMYRAAQEGAGPDRLVVKFGREQGFMGLPGAWIGRWLLRREKRFHQRVDGVEGIQRWVAQISDSAYALEYLDGRTLDTFESPPGEGGQFFDELRRLIDALHARQAAYCDLHKRSNILVRPDGRPALIDFQISVLLDDGPDTLRRRCWKRCVAYLQGMDLYNLYKHKRRMARAFLTEEERRLSYPRNSLLRLHRTLVTPLRHLRRAFLTRLHRAGRLVSPSAHLEDHHQPEKQTWRK